MLRDKDQIVNHGHIAQRKLDRVARDARPVALHIAVDGLLRDAEDAAREVEQDLRDAPALGRPVAVVDDHLGRVLDEGDNQLDVRDGIDGVQPHPSPDRRVYAVALGGAEDDEEHHNDAGHAAEEGAQDEAAWSVSDTRGETPGMGKEILASGDKRQQETMSGKCDVVELHRRG